MLWTRTAPVFGWLAFIVVLTVCQFDLRADEAPAGTIVTTGSKVNLLKLWPQIKQAPKAGLATLEFLIRPDTAAVSRPRSFILILADSGGRDTKGCSLTMNAGAIRANVFGTKLQADTKLKPNEWVHVALTIDTRTVNKQARLWLNGKPVGEQLVLEYWPTSFAVAEMLSDKWNQGRVFSGQLGDVRLSRVVRYRDSFTPPRALPDDEHAVLRLPGNSIPLE